MYLELCFAYQYWNIFINIQNEENNSNVQGSLTWDSRNLCWGKGKRYGIILQRGSQRSGPQWKQLENYRLETLKYSNVILFIRLLQGAKRHKPTCVPAMSLSLSMATAQRTWRTTMHKRELKQHHTSSAWKLKGTLSLCVEAAATHWSFLYKCRVSIFP